MVANYIEEHANIYMPFVISPIASDNLYNHDTSTPDAIDDYISSIPDHNTSSVLASAFEKRERARVTYSYYTITAQSHYWSVRYSLRLPLLVRMPLLVQMQYLSNRWIEPELMI